MSICHIYIIERATSVLPGTRIDARNTNMESDAPIQHSPNENRKSWESCIAINPHHVHGDILLLTGCDVAMYSGVQYGVLQYA